MEMNTHYILEDNLERLEKKLARIQNKCNQYNYTFSYTQLEPVYRELTLESGQKITSKFIPIQVEGEVKHQDWRFVATLNHHAEGNIIRQFDTELEIPDRYRTTDCVCEHCNTKRNRKDTYIVYNDVTNEFKQVGKTCLEEYTSGLSADLVAHYVAMFDELIKGCAPYTGVSATRYYTIEDILAYGYECVKHFGYWRTDSDRPTRSRALDYYLLESGWNGFGKLEKERLEKELASVSSFNAMSESNIKKVKDSINWVKTNNDTGSYMHNLRTICASPVVAAKDLGILVSLVPTYNKHVLKMEEEMAEAKRRAVEASSSNFVGAVGDRITFIPTSVECVYSNETIWGWTRLYKFVDENNNIYMWWSSSGINQDKEIAQITGTVKSHEDYKGTKQTHLTRCKVAYK